jgi:succinoglycan biosynthesis protein ExoM
MEPGSPSYSVCITTARRNEFLRDLLASVEQQTWLPAPDAFEVIVVDNNPEGSAKAIVDAFATRPWHVRYLHCPVTSIPVSRNTAVEAARFRDVVLIDDDQLLPPDLFRRLDESWRDQPAATAAGLFHRKLRFEPGVSIWARRGGVDAPLEYSHGSPVPPSHAHTGGVVVRRAVFDRVRFDPKWGLRGCDDNAFFKAVGHTGLGVVYLKDVEIIERIQAARSTFGALMAQGFQQGLCFAHVELQAAGRAGVALFLAKAFIAFGLYGLALPFSVLRRRLGAVRTLKMFVRQAGKIVGVFGFSYDYYSK